MNGREVQGILPLKTSVFVRLPWRIHSVGMKVWLGRLSTQ
jgi:hypothetical protein